MQVAARSAASCGVLHRHAACAGSDPGTDTTVLADPASCTASIQSHVPTSRAAATPAVEVRKRFGETRPFAVLKRPQTGNGPNSSAGCWVRPWARRAGSSAKRSGESPPYKEHSMRLARATQPARKKVDRAGATRSKRGGCNVAIGNRLGNEMS